jgi:hypothetical protein
VLAPTFTVIVDEPPTVTGFGLKLTLVPEGTPLALRLTDSAEPLVTAVEIVEAPLLPCATLRLLGLALIEKSDGAVTVSATVVACAALEPAPVIVSV